MRPSHKENSKRWIRKWYHLPVPEDAYYDELEEWLQAQSSEGHYIINRRGDAIHFELEADAVLFAIAWSGKPSEHYKDPFAKRKRTTPYIRPCEQYINVNSKWIPAAHFR